MILCDTDVIIEYLKGDEKTKISFQKIGIPNIELSAITLMELLFGALNKRELKQIRRALENFTILTLNEEITEISINLIENYSKSHGLKIPDALIAATALCHDLKLWTYNLKDFQFIKGLNLLV